MKTNTVPRSALGRRVAIALLAVTATSGLAACGDDAEQPVTASTEVVDTIDRVTTTAEDVTPSTTTTTMSPSTTTSVPPTTAPSEGGPGDFASPTTTPNGETPPEPALQGTGNPIDAAFVYVESLADADYERAWSLLHPRSRETFPGGWEGFHGETGLVEGTGSLSSIPHHRYQVAVFDATPEDELVTVVSAWGEVSQEGETMWSAFAWGVRSIDGFFYVELLQSPGLQFTSPSQPGASIEPADGVRATFEPGPGILEVVAAVAGSQRDITLDEDPENSDVAVIEVTSFDTGSQQVVIGVLQENGDLHARASFFSV